MALKNGVLVTVNLVGDGTSVSFSFDLLKDPYFLNNTNVANWFAVDRKAPEPIGIFSSSNDYTATLVGSVVTITFTVAPAANAVTGPTIYVLFNGR